MRIEGSALASVGGDQHIMQAMDKLLTACNQIAQDGQDYAQGGGAGLVCTALTNTYGRALALCGVDLTEGDTLKELLRVIVAVNQDELARQEQGPH